MNVKTKELLEKVINNVAFIFDGVIDFNKISLLYSAGWWNKEKIKFYVLKSNLVEKIYELTPTGEEIVCVLIEDLDEKVIIKNKLRKVGQQFITNIDGTKISSLKDKIDIQKKNAEPKGTFYSSMYGKMNIYSRVERFVDESFIFNDSYSNCNEFIEKEFFDLYNHVLKLKYQKDFYNTVNYDDILGFNTYPAEIFHFYFINNEYNSNNDVVKIINCKYGNLSSITAEKLSKVEVDNLKEALITLYFESTYPNYIEDNDKDFIELNKKIASFSSKIKDVYGEFLTLYRIEKGSINFFPESYTYGENIMCFVFKKGILIVYSYLCD